MDGNRHYDLGIGYTLTVLVAAGGISRLTGTIGMVEVWIEMTTPRLHSFPFGSTISKPYFDLHICQSQSFGQFRSLVQSQVLLG